MRPILLALPAFALVSACEKAVEIVYPNTYNDKPVREITVKFSKNFKPGSFTARFDGQDITGSFVPAPSPGGQSTAQLPADECGFVSGDAPPSPPPPQNPPVHIDDRPPEKNPSSGAIVQQGTTGIGSSSTAPIPQPPAGLTVLWHSIVVGGSCKSPLICEGDKRQFLPLHLVGVPLQLPITFGRPGYFEVETWPKASQQIPVKVMRQTPSVTYNGTASTSTAVPAGGRSPAIQVDAVVRPSAHTTYLCSLGVQRGVVRGDIQ